MIEKLKVDHLTGLFLRDSFRPLLEKLVSEAKLNNGVFSIALIDLDRFKKFNDKFGHDFGDKILVHFSGVLRISSCEERYHFFRYGGDEFIAVFTSLNSREALNFMKQFSSNLNRVPATFKNKFYKIGMSCGIAEFPGDGKTIDELLAKADEAMYFSKRHGRNLIILANRIKHLESRRFFSLISSIFIIVWSLFIFYRLTLKTFILPAANKLKNVRIEIKPKNLVFIILKNGTLVEGYILEKTKDKVIVSLQLPKGRGTIVLKRTEIASIRNFDDKSNKIKE